MHDEMLKGGFSWRVLNIGWCVFSGREVESIGHHILLCTLQCPATEDPATTVVSIAKCPSLDQTLRAALLAHIRTPG